MEVPDIQSFLCVGSKIGMFHFGHCT